MLKDSKLQFFKEDELRSFSKSVFTHIGHSEEDADLASDVLLASDLRGIDSHGVSRLTGYVNLWKAGRINVKPQIKIVRDRKSMLNIDGDGGLGLIVAPKAMNLVIERCKNHGSGWASIQNSNHFGIAGYHALMACEHEMVGLAMTNATPFVSPTHSTEKMLGTNPIACAIPTQKKHHIVVDLATSAVARGKLEIAKRADKPIPEGWLQTKDGRPTLDPDDILDDGALLPLGSSAITSSHKGYALSSMVDIFTGVLSGANFGPWVPPFVSFLPLLPDLPGKGLGHFLGAWDLDGFQEKSEAYKALGKWMDTFKGSKRINENQPVMIPGEPEYLAELERKKSGIPLNDKVTSSLHELAKTLNIPF